MKTFLMNKSLFQCQENFTQHDVENKELKEENEKSRKENEKLRKENEKQELTNENEQF